jgi:hypothetical protein
LREVFQTIVGIAGIAIACKALESSNESKQQVEIAREAYKLALHDSNTASQHADSARRSALAAKALSDSAKHQVDVGKAANELTKQNAEKTREIAAISNAIADAAKTEAKRTADSAKLSNHLSANKAIHELRAYLSVMGTDLRYDPAGHRMVAVVTLENTGLSPAHDVEFFYEVYCEMRNNGVPQPGGKEFQNHQVAVQRSLGPRSKVKFQKEWPLGPTQGTNMFGRKEMDMWIQGAVQFRDEFTTTTHFTEFSFTQGRHIATTNQWEMIFTPFGNRSDRPKDRVLGDAALPVPPISAPAAPAFIPAPAPPPRIDDDLFK